jgi:hypothetical protein
MTWGQIASWPVTPLGTYTSTDSGTKELNRTTAIASGTKIYVRSVAMYGTGTGCQFYEYNPATDTYTAKATPPFVQAKGFMVVVSGHIYIIADVNSSGAEGKFYDYNISANTWTTTRRTLTSVGASPANIQGACYADGKIWVVDQPPRTTPGKFSLHQYDIDLDTWSLNAATPPVDLLAYREPVVYNDEIYFWVQDGVTTGAKPSYVWKFNPSTSTWSSVCAMLSTGNRALDQATLEPIFSADSLLLQGGLGNGLGSFGSVLLNDVMRLESPYDSYRNSSRYGSISISLSEPMPQLDLNPNQSFENFVWSQTDFLQLLPSGQYKLDLCSPAAYNGTLYYFLITGNVSLNPDNSATYKTSSACYKYTPDIIAAPTSVTPSGTINTDVPSLAATVAQTNDKKIVQWEVATDAAFTLNKKEIFDYVNTTFWGITSPSASSGVFSTSIQPDYGELSQGTWYLRARSSSGGNIGPWSNTQALVVSHPPAMVPTSPVGDVTLDFGSQGAVTLQWNFTDSSSTDSQTAFQIIAEDNTDGTLLLDTGKFPSQFIKSYAWNLPSARKDSVIRWKVRGWDSDDVVGNYSSYALFRMSDKPTVTITSPTDGSQVSSGRPTVMWTFVASGGRVQSSYRVRFYSDQGVLISDSGTTFGTSTSYQLDTQILDVGSYSVHVDVTDSRGLTATASVGFTTEFEAPVSPTFMIDSSNYTQYGYIEVIWDSSSQDYAFASYSVYRRLLGTTDWTLLGEYSNISADYSWKDYTAASNTSYEYVVTQKALRFSILNESSKTTPGPQATTGQSDQYWLVHPTDPSLSILLRNVNSEEFTDEKESQELLLIGRGRHVDYGTRWGYKGTLSAQIRNAPDGTSAREIRLRLELLRNSETTMLLRNPFGDIWQVAVSDMAFQRVAGVGIQEFLNVTIPYSEVV